MKKHIPILLCFLVSAISFKSFSQAEAPGWKWNNNLRSNEINWADEQNGILCALGGCSYFTTDGGQNWDCVTSSTGILDNSSMSKTAMLSADHMVVLTQTKVYTTFTGFMNFSSTLTSGHYFKDVCFVDDNHGWISAASGSMWKTTNGGATWTSLPSAPGSTTLNTVAFNSLTNGCVGSIDGKIYYTANGGGAWTAATLPASVTADIAFTAIRYRNSNEVIACGSSQANQNAVIIRSIDAGHTWTTVHADLAEIITDMDFRNSDTAYAVGLLFSPRYLNGPSLIYQSVNGGQTWTQLPFNSMSGCDFYGMSFTDPAWGWIAGWSCLYKFDAGSPTGFTEHPLTHSGFHIYPNPASDKFHVTVGFQDTDNCQYEISDVSGKTILRGESLRTEFDVDAGSLNSGIYFMQIKSGANLAVKKFSKQ